MTAAAKPWKGMAMEGVIASWYAKNTERDVRRFEDAARVVSERAPSGAHVLEIAPGPGFLAVELARRGYRVTGLDVSRSFVRIASENAAKAGVNIDFRLGDAANLPFAEGVFDFVVCMAAFKNFTDPLGALNQIHRVLKPGGRAAILDLRKDASHEAIDEEVRGMNLSPLNAMLTRWIFRNMLLRSAYPRPVVEDLAARSQFGGGDVIEQGVGFELRLSRAP